MGTEFALGTVEAIIFRTSSEIGIIFSFPTRILIRRFGAFWTIVTPRAIAVNVTGQIGGECIDFSLSNHTVLARRAFDTLMGTQGIGIGASFTWRRSIGPLRAKFPFLTFPEPLITLQEFKFTYSISTFSIGTFESTKF